MKIIITILILFYSITIQSKIPSNSKYEARYIALSKEIELPPNVDNAYDFYVHVGRLRSSYEEVKDQLNKPSESEKLKADFWALFDKNKEKLLKNCKNVSRFYCYGFATAITAVEKYEYGLDLCKSNAINAIDCIDYSYKLKDLSAFDIYAKKYCTLEDGSGCIKVARFSCEKNNIEEAKSAVEIAIVFVRKERAKSKLIDSSKAVDPTKDFGLNCLKKDPIYKDVPSLFIP